MGQWDVLNGTFAGMEAGSQALCVVGARGINGYVWTFSWTDIWSSASFSPLSSRELDPSPSYIDPPLHQCMYGIGVFERHSLEPVGHCQQVAVWGTPCNMEA